MRAMSLGNRVQRIEDRHDFNTRNVRGRSRNAIALHARPSVESREFLNHAESEIGGPGGRLHPTLPSGLRVGRRAEIGSAPDFPRLASRGSLGRDAVLPGTGLSVRAVLQPLADVAAEIVQPPGIGLMPANRSRTGGDAPAAALASPPAGAGGVFPLRRRRQAVDLAGLFRQPARVRRGLLAGNVHDRAGAAAAALVIRERHVRCARVPVVVRERHFMPADRDQMLESRRPCARARGSRRNDGQAGAQPTAAAAQAVGEAIALLHRLLAAKPVGGCRQPGLATDERAECPEVAPAVDIVVNVQVRGCVPRTAVGPET